MSHLLDYTLIKFGSVTDEFKNKFENHPQGVKYLESYAAGNRSYMHYKESEIDADNLKKRVEALSQKGADKPSVPQPGRHGDPGMSM